MTQETNISKTEKYDPRSLSLGEAKMIASNVEMLRVFDGVLYIVYDLSTGEAVSSQLYIM